jgi:uncharacterized glyoxalase superfamily protein PhnB
VETMIEPIKKSGETKTEACPKGFHTVNAALTCVDTRREIDFLKQALGARELYRLEDPETKKITHAEIEVGDTLLSLADPIPSMGGKTVKDLGGSPVTFYLYVDDVDALFAQATKAGGKVKDPVKDMFWGDRVGSFNCPEGFHWSVATHKRDLKPEEINEGYKKFKKELAGAAK